MSRTKNHKADHYVALAERHGARRVIEHLCEVIAELREKEAKDARSTKIR